MAEGSQTDLSRLQVVAEFDHEEEVIKARCMPQDQTLVASMTNTGLINIYNMPEIGSVQQPGKTCEIQRLKTQLSGLEEESFALSWNKHKKGLLTSTQGT